MAEYVMSGLVVLMGLISAGVGMMSARRHLQAASRAHQRVESLYDTIPDGWGSWFAGGFSSLTLGTRWMGALAAMVGWMLAGVFLIGLGVRLFWRM